MLLLCQCVCSRDYHVFGIKFLSCISLLLLVTDSLSTQHNWNVYSKLVTDEKQTLKSLFSCLNLWNLGTVFPISFRKSFVQELYSFSLRLRRIFLKNAIRNGVMGLKLSSIFIYQNVFPFWLICIWWKDRRESWNTYLDAVAKDSNFLDSECVKNQGGDERFLEVLSALTQYVPLCYT